MDYFWLLVLVIGLMGWYYIWDKVNGVEENENAIWQILSFLGVIMISCCCYSFGLDNCTRTWAPLLYVLSLILAIIFGVIMAMVVEPFIENRDYDPSTLWLALVIILFAIFAWFVPSESTMKFLKVTIGNQQRRVYETCGLL